MKHCDYSHLHGLAFIRRSIDSLHRPRLRTAHLIAQAATTVLIERQLPKILAPSMLGAQSAPGITSSCAHHWSCCKRSTARAVRAATETLRVGLASWTSGVRSMPPFVCCCCPVQTAGLRRECSRVQCLSCLRMLKPLFSGRFWTDIFSPCLAWALTSLRGRDMVRPMADFCG